MRACKRDRQLCWVVEDRRTPRNGRFAAGFCTRILLLSSCPDVVFVRAIPRSAMHGHVPSPGWPNEDAAGEDGRIVSIVFTAILGLAVLLTLAPRLRPWVTRPLMYKREEAERREALAMVQRRRGRDDSIDGVLDYGDGDDRRTRTSYEEMTQEPTPSNRTEAHRRSSSHGDGSRGRREAAAQAAMQRAMEQQQQQQALMALLRLTQIQTTGSESSRMPLRGDESANRATRTNPLSAGSVETRSRYPFLAQWEEELSRAVSVLESNGASSECIQRLLTIADNIITHPFDLRYRSFRMSNPAFVSLWEGPCREVLQSMGFREKKGQAGASTEAMTGVVELDVQHVTEGHLEAYRGVAIRLEVLLRKSSNKGGMHAVDEPGSSQSCMHGMSGK